MANLLQVQDDTFESEVLRSNIPVLVDFSATWCGPCKVLAPTLEGLAKEYAGQVKFVGIDVEQAQQTAMKFGVMSVPTVIVFKNGQVAGQAVGALPRDHWKKMLDGVLAG